MSDKPEVEIIVEGENRLTLIFPEGVNVNLKERVPLDDLLKILTAPEADVEGQWCRLNCMCTSVVAGVRG